MCHPCKPIHDSENDIKPLEDRILVMKSKQLEFKRFMLIDIFLALGALGKIGIYAKRENSGVILK